VVSRRREVLQVSQYLVVIYFACVSVALVSVNLCSNEDGKFSYRLSYRTLTKLM
jgi:hypothetical protein